jgi:hypothetical protein
VQGLWGSRALEHAGTWAEHGLTGGPAEKLQARVIRDKVWSVWPCPPARLAPPELLPVNSLG